MEPPPQTPFDKLLARLNPDRDQAGLLYEEMRLKLVKFFTWKNCTEADVHADHALDRVARRLDEGIAIQNLNAYAYQVARYMVLELYRQPAAPELPLPDVPPPRMDCLERCLTVQPERDRELILSYYEGEGGEKIDKRKKLAQKLNITTTALKIRCCRIRTRLETCINECMKRE